MKRCLLVYQKSQSEIEAVQSCPDSLPPHGHQAPPSVGFSRQEYQSGLPFPSQGILPDPGIEPRSPALQMDTLPSSHQGSPNVKVKVAQSCLTLCNPWTIQSTEFSRPEYWSGQPFPSQGIFPTQGSIPCLLHCRQILHQLSHKGSPTSLQGNTNQNFKIQHLYLLGWQRSKGQTITTGGKDVKRQEPSHIASGNVKQYSHFGKIVWQLFKQ